MKLLRYLFIAATTILFSVSCMQLPISSSEPVNNNTYIVDYLFEHDGCKVYRFYDRGRYVYFTKCDGSYSVFKPDSSQANVINTNYFPAGK